MELKDIALKKGDIVIYKNGTQKLITNEEIMTPQGTFAIEIKRPIKYETIYETAKQILDKEEKEYLEGVIRPFRDRVIYVSKISNSKSEYIRIGINDDYCMLPYFKAGTMYKGMKLDKEYTLEELGLFEE